MSTRKLPAFPIVMLALAMITLVIVAIVVIPILQEGKDVRGAQFQVPPSWIGIQKVSTMRWREQAWVSKDAFAIDEEGYLWLKSDATTHDKVNPEKGIDIFVIKVKSDDGTRFYADIEIPSGPRKLFFRVFDKNVSGLRVRQVLGDYPEPEDVPYFDLGK